MSKEAFPFPLSTRSLHIFLADPARIQSVPYAELSPVLTTPTHDDPALDQLKGDWVSRPNVRAGKTSYYSSEGNEAASATTSMR